MYYLHAPPRNHQNQTIYVISPSKEYDQIGIVHLILVKNKLSFAHCLVIGQTTTSHILGGHEP